MAAFERTRTRIHSSLLTLVLAGAFSTSVWAVEPFKLRDIRIEGLQRTDPGTVFASLPFRIGDTYTDEKGVAALRALFATGLYKDVRIQIDGDAVVVVIEERPIIADVSFIGLKEFDRDALTKSLKDVGIGEGRPFDRALADRAEQELKRQYLTKSYYGAEVTTTITPLERNRVNVTFAVVEGEPAKIADIRILGNKVFSESTLMGLFDQTKSGWLTWYTKTDRYSRTKLNGDLELLSSYYRNRGYLEFNVESTQVTISPDKQHISVAVTVNEGQPYTVAAVKLEGDYLGQLENFKSLVAIKPGEPFNGETVTQTTRAFSDYFGAFGYAFPRVEARQDIDRATGQVTVTLVSSPERRAYVRRISVAGNNKTRDEVIRREFRQFEGAWYDGQRIKASKERVDRLGFFESVEVDTVEVPGAPDQVDVVLTVKERSTGAVTFGMGYSSQTKMTLTGSIRQDNFLGSGRGVELELNTSKIGRAVVVGLTDPYSNEDGVSRRLDLFYRTSRPLSNLGEVYEFASEGGKLTWGVPVAEFDTVFFGAGYERTKITETQGVPNNIFKYAQAFGRSSVSIPLTIGWANDNRDNLLSPISGSMKRVNLEFSPGGDARYGRLNIQAQKFFPIGSKFTLMLNGEVGAGKALGGRLYPVFKTFYAGGLGSVRTFEGGSLGPVDNTGARSGGNLKVNLNAELYIPVPGAGKDRTFRLFTFVDVGNVWNTESNYEKVGISSLRASAGIGLSWMSPVGPLRLSWGKPIRYQPHDRIERFQFQIGNSF
ncbi:outer membrane protein assembly factor BamA [Inhella gelatinilytica]|uniref:Outer membrane protein assembly factor BamA n=1 Tax=Inhella gelatinilytica TaxID=2795030 RepID=A0A931J115_9BURK|nr:outer membrane protein assembly factor BamA [Inhella gelatinilytica]MBH9553396.1 outer membrane protein assembly factor BamA [Inhella gelatinilytica]